MVMHVCKVEGCEKVEHSRTVCRMHYERYRRNGKYEALTTEEKLEARRVQFQKKQAQMGAEDFPRAKACTQCGAVKSIDQFFTRKTKHGPKPYSHCKACHIKMNAENAKRRRAAARAKREQERQENLPNGGICVAKECDREIEIVKDGLCKMHYQRTRDGISLDQPSRIRKLGMVDGDESIRVCTTCDKVKSVGEFYGRPNGGTQAQCRVCMTSLNGLRQHLKRHNDIAEAYRMVADFEGTLRKRADRVIRMYLERNDNEQER